MKWWLLAGSVFLTFLALGRNFDSFNDLMFHYLPLYNKFRTVEMALVIPGLVFPIVAIWGLAGDFGRKSGGGLFEKRIPLGLGIDRRPLCDPLADAFLVVGFPVCI